MNVASIALLKAGVHMITRIAGNIWPKLFDNCLRYLDFFLTIVVIILKS